MATSKITPPRPSPLQRQRGRENIFIRDVTEQLEVLKATVAKVEEMINTHKRKRAAEDAAEDAMDEAMQPPPAKRSTTLATASVDLSHMKDFSEAVGAPSVFYAVQHPDRRCESCYKCYVEAAYYALRKTRNIMPGFASRNTFRGEQLALAAIRDEKGGCGNAACSHGSVS